MNNERGTIIVVGRNNLHLTKLAVKSALAQDIPCSVILVDNASTDGTLDWARTVNGLARSTFGQQRSLAACWNYALNTIFRRDKWNNRMANSEHALILNNDVELLPSTYRMLLAHGGPFVTAVSVDKKEQLEAWDGKGGSERPHPDFSCFLIRREVFEKVGPFNEECFPAYVEDCFYHVRMHRAGIKAVCIDVPFLHHGASTLKQADEAEGVRIRRGADANKQRFFEAYGCYPGTPEYEKLFA